MNAHTFRVTCIRFCSLLVCLAAAFSPAQAQENLAASPNLFLPVNPALYTLMNEIDDEQLLVHLASLQNVGTRHVNSPKNMPDQGIGAAAKYIQSEFEAIRDESGSLIVFTQDFAITWAGRTSNQQNIGGLIPGTDPLAGAVVIGAHYDSRCADLNDGLCFAPGANDNASGVAALIELARVLSVNHTHHRVSIILVAFSAEEIGLVGSRIFISEFLHVQGIPVSAMINLDSIGGTQANEDVFTTDAIRLFSAGPDDSPSRHLARTIHFAANHYVTDMAVLVQDAADRTGRYGDHISFSEAGYAAVRFIEEVENFNHQHNGLDMLDDVQFPYLRRATRTILTAIIMLADGPVPPQSPGMTLSSDGSCSLVWDAAAGATNYVVALRSAASLVYEVQFEVSDTSMPLSSETLAQFSSAAVAAKDANSLLGPLSAELSLASASQPCRIS